MSVVGNVSNTDSLLSQRWLPRRHHSQPQPGYGEHPLQVPKERICDLEDHLLPVFLTYGEETTIM
jgi:hypothetical protein